jgi:integrase/recombinase XerD
VLKFAQARKWRPDNPARDYMPLLTERRSPILLPNPVDISMVVKAAPGMMTKLIQAAWMTGCRIEGLVTAKCSQLDHVRKQLTVIGKRNRLRVTDLEGWGYDEVFKSLAPKQDNSWLFWLQDSILQFERLVNRVEAQAESRHTVLLRSASTTYCTDTLWTG